MTTLSIVIPAYNEQYRLSRVFSALNSWHTPRGFKIDQVIFVNDGSTDATLEILKNTKIKFAKKIISYKTNKGKGYAVKRGMLASTADYTLLTDADMSTPLTQFDKFIPFLKAKIDCVVGTRKNGFSTVSIHQPWLRENMGKVFTLLSRTVLGVNVTDFTCGFKVFSLDCKNQVFKRSHINRWGYDSEVLFLAHKLGFNIVEKAVLWADQKNTKVNLLRDSVNSLKELIDIRLNYFTGKYQIQNPYRYNLS